MENKLERLNDSKFVQPLSDQESMEATGGISVPTFVVDPTGTILNPDVDFRTD